MTIECYFHLEILAPKGLAGIEPHLHLCNMDLTARVSGFTGQVILSSKVGEERFEFEMDPSNTDTLDASGAVFCAEVEAWALLESLSNALCAAGFSHEIGMDDANGDLFKRIRVDCNDLGDRFCNHAHQPRLIGKRVARLNVRALNIFARIFGVFALLASAWAFLGFVIAVDPMLFFMGLFCLILGIAFLRIKKLPVPDVERRKDAP